MEAKMMTIKTDKLFLVTCADMENYNHDAGHPYYKIKSAGTYVVRGCDRIQDAIACVQVDLNKWFRTKEGMLAISSGRVLPAFPSHWDEVTEDALGDLYYYTELNWDDVMTPIWGEDV